MDWMWLPGRRRLNSCSTVAVGFANVVAVVASTDAAAGRCSRHIEHSAAGSFGNLDQTAGILAATAAEIGKGKKMQQPVQFCTAAAVHKSAGVAHEIQPLERCCTVPAAAALDVARTVPEIKRRFHNVPFKMRK